VGKWASQRHGKRAAMFGSVPPPDVADLSVDSENTSSITCELVFGIRPPADGWKLSAKPLAGGATSYSALLTGSTGAVTGLASATTYYLRFAWFVGSVQISDWSDAIQDTTA
jgi:hypothetical protein